MFIKSFIVFAACLSIVLAVPEPKADPKADPLLVSTYSAGLPLVNTYSAAGIPYVSAYSAAHAYHHHYPVHARTISVDGSLFSHHHVAAAASADVPLIRTVAADLPVAVSAINPLHYTAVSTPVVGGVVV